METLYRIYEGVKLGKNPKIEDFHFFIFFEFILIYSQNNSPSIYNIGSIGDIQGDRHVQSCASFSRKGSGKGLSAQSLPKVRSLKIWSTCSSHGAIRASTFTVALEFNQESKRLWRIQLVILSVPLSPRTG